MTYATSFKTITYKVLAAVAMFSLVASAVPAQVFADDVPPANEQDQVEPMTMMSFFRIADPKIDICHATDSHTNPYNGESPSQTADAGGHDGHGPSNSIWFPGTTEDWGDIIPPFTNGAISYPGKNWTIQGQAIYNNDCETTSKITVDKIVIGTTTVKAKDFDLKVGTEPVSDDKSEKFTPGTYKVTETPKTGVPTNFVTTFGGDCDAQGNITLGVAQNKKCTITNDYTPVPTTGTVKIQKTVVNDDGGSVVEASAFTFKIDGTVVAVNTPITLAPGVHTVSEDPFAGYTASPWGGACAANGSITVVAGQNYTCSITNNDNKVVAAAIDLSVTKSASDATPAENGTLVYTITVNNAGPDAATNVVVTDTLPTGLSFVSADPVATTPSPLTWNLGTLASGATRTITVTATVDAGTGDRVILNTVTVAGTETDSNPANNSASASVTVETSTVPAVCTISSDTTTLANGTTSVLTFVHPAWTKEFTATPATWIWDSAQSQAATFTKVFNVNTAPAGAVLKIAVDNSYTATLNGTPLTCDGSGIENFGSADTCTAPVVAGINTLEVAAQNFGGPNTNDASNPAGAIFTIDITGSTCSAVPPTVPKKYTIDGYKFNDIDADGVWDKGEPTLAGWTIRLYDDTTETTISTTTKTDGSYSFEVEAGDFTISEVQQTGWEQTTQQGEARGVCTVAFPNQSEETAFSCDFGNHALPAQCLMKGENLISNPSFETPIVVANSGQWEIFPTVAGWTISSDGLELWKGLFGGASQGLQNAELDGNQSTNISQSVPTVVGNNYKLTYDFAARPNTVLAENQMDVVINGVVVDTVSAASVIGTTAWAPYVYEFTAAATATVVEFRDKGTSNKVGTLLDNTALCLTKDNTVPAPVLYMIYGNVWNDADEDGVETPFREEGEASLAGWIVTITNGLETFSTTTDSLGYYEFNVPAGTWTISDGAPADWTQTYPINEGNVHVVTVPPVVDPEDSEEFSLEGGSIFAKVMNFIIPTAFAQRMGFGPYNFGNVYDADNSGTTPSDDDDDDADRTTGTRTNRNNRSGEVLGAATSNPLIAGQVLGAASSTMPVGAPNTGAGGSSSRTAVVPTLFAILSTVTAVRKTK